MSNTTKQAMNLKNKECGKGSARVQQKHYDQYMRNTRLIPGTTENI